ncbi:MAG: NADH:flavin oxidoreductase [Gammaproteobacteria bacterium]|nr:NADH:flavin oxidoreductase [Gammaproteobacteria bacterium]
MWKPPQKIKHEVDPGPWPTADQAAKSLLYSPVRVGRLELEQRTWVPAMVPWRASEDGFVTEDVLDWYERFARGRPGAIVIEATGIRDVPSGPLLRIGHDRFVPGLGELARTVHRASDGHTRLFIQIIDFLAIKRRPDPTTYFRKYLRITDRLRRNLEAEYWPEERIREHLIALADDDLDEILDERELEALRMGYRERVDDVHLPHIRELPQVLPDLFAQAARRAMEAGIDGVELHYAHAYTMASFLSARNRRTDGYGGTREARARLPLEVYARVREVVGPDYTVGCRFLTDDCIAGGSTPEDAEYFGAAFARAGMDFLSLSRGGKFEDARQPAVGWSVYPYTGPSGYECMPVVISDEFGPFGRNAAPAARIRKAIRAAGFETPVVLVGGFHGFERSEAALRRGDADIIGSARQSLADPDWFRKVQLGRGAETRICKFTNYCEGLDQKHKQVTCQRWDREQMDAHTRRTKDGKRRMTAPAWPA